VGEPPPASPREEAERLVAAAVATASTAARGWLARSGHTVATGSEPCCVCPLCRAVSVLRDPDPELVERLASGAGDLAEGVSAALRAAGDLLRPAAPAAGPEAADRAAPDGADPDPTERAAPARDVVAPEAADRAAPGPDVATPEPADPASPAPDVAGEPADPAPSAPVATGPEPADPANPPGRG
jgi:hypothetical protein